MVLCQETLNGKINVSFGNLEGVYVVNARTAVMVVHPFQEVIVRRYNSINAVCLGIVPKRQKAYTDAERKLHTATDLNVSASVGGILGGSVAADPLLKYLSGRTAMFKKQIEIEKKDFFMKLLEKMFSMETFVDRLKIPLEYVKGFQYYVVENE